MAFTYFKVKSAKCLCLLPVVLVLRIWSCLHHWDFTWHHDEAERLPCFSIGSQVQDNRLLLVNESGNHDSAAAGLTDAAASRQVVLVGQ